MTQGDHTFIGASTSRLLRSKYNLNDVSGIGIFSSDQLEFFHNIGLTGDLFKDVLNEYKKQGRTIVDMQHDLLSY